MLNKRQIKKRLKKKQWFSGFVNAEGNNGGDFIVIEDRGNGLLYIRSGSCCVMTIDAIVPVEFLTSTLERVLLENDLDVKKVIDTSGWSTPFREELKAKVRDKY